MTGVICCQAFKGKIWYTAMYILRSIGSLFYVVFYDLQPYMKVKKVTQLLFINNTRICYNF
jgi:hypothetical protein